MTRSRESRGLLSRLPDDEAYWDGLADRLVLDAAGRLRAYRHARQRWWHGLSRLSTPLALAAAASIVAALLWLPEIGGRAEPDARAMNANVFGLMPAGPLAEQIVGSTTAPTMATLFVMPTMEVSR